jgi:hypothetical protein
MNMRVGYGSLRLRVRVRKIKTLVFTVGLHFNEPFMVSNAVLLPNSAETPLSLISTVYSRRNLILNVLAVSYY